MLCVQAGDKVAFSVLVDRHKGLVVSCIYRYVGREEDANDLAQEVFLRLWRFSRHYHATSKFTTWLYAVTANICKSEVQSAWRRKIRLIGSFWSAAADAESVLSEAASLSPSPEDTSLREEQSRLVRSAVQSLPRKQRLALILSRYEQLSYQEIATILGCSVSAVESLLVRAKTSLKKKLAPLRK